MPGSLGVVQNCQHFRKRTEDTLEGAGGEGEGFETTVCFFPKINTSLTTNQHFIVCFWGGGKGSCKKVLSARFHKC